MIRRLVRQPNAMLLVLLLLGTAIAVAAGVAIRMQRQAPEAKAGPQVAAQEPQPAPAPAESPKAAQTAPKFTGKGKDAPAPRAQQPLPKAQPAPTAQPAPKPRPVAEPPAPMAEQASRPPSAVERPAETVIPPAPATLRLTIVPWGEVFVDGKSRGVSPPMRQIPVSPGKHLIVVQNTSLPPHTQQVDLRPGEQFTIRHRFD